MYSPMSMATRWRYAVVVTLCCLVTLPLSTQAQETSRVPVLVDGETVRLAMRIYKPVSGNPAPTLVFNHGSTGMGTDPGLFSRPIDAPAVARFFVQRGWAVVMPARRGRGGSDGLYDEGFAADRSRGYTCDPAVSSAAGSGRVAVPPRPSIALSSRAADAIPTTRSGSTETPTPSIPWRTAGTISARFRPPVGEGRSMSSSAAIRCRAIPICGDTPWSLT